MHEGDITGPLLAPNGGSNGLDPFYATTGEHWQTLHTPGPMADVHPRRRLAPW